MHPATFIGLLPHARELGLRFERYDEVSHTCVMRLPFSEALVGDPERGFLHGGAMTTLLDTLGGAAVLALERTVQATLDLRVDYLRPAVLGADLIAEAACYRHTRHVAFVRGRCHQGDPDKPVAELTATFVLADPETKVGEIKT
jgi:uncharacterized protein (TIGR00369 family)